MSSDRRLGLAMAALTALLWGFLGIALKVALDWVPPITIVWLRFAAAFVVLAVLLGVRRPQCLRILVRPPVLALVAAAGLTANYVFYLLGVHFTSPGHAQVLIQLAPLLLAGVGVLFFGERLTRGQALWGLVALAGMGLFYRDQLTQLVGADGAAAGDGSLAADAARGNLWILVAAVSWVVYAGLQKRLTARDVTPQDLNLLLYLFPAVVLTPFVEWDTLAPLSGAQWGMMAFLAANTLVAYGALGEALKRLPAHEVSLIIILNPLITLATMAVLTLLEVTWIEPERISPWGYGAAVVVLIGVIGVLRRPRARSVRPVVGPDRHEGEVV